MKPGYPLSLLALGRFDPEGVIDNAFLESLDIEQNPGTGRHPQTADGPTP
jgi:hypothetical protein